MIDDIAIADDMEIDEDIITVVDDKSKLREYLQDQRIARYLIEYTRWLYSRWLYEQNKTESSQELLEEFVIDYMRIKHDFEYGPIDKKFMWPNPSLGIGRKLCIKTIETQKRLIYTLQIFIQQHSNTLITYHLQHSLSDYYMYVTDFATYRTQVILEGNIAVKKWIDEQNRDYFLHPCIQPDVQDYNPYFFSNPLVGPGIYMLQPAESLDHALSISKTWNTRQINNTRADEIQHLKTYKFTIYAYINKLTINKLVFNADNPGNDKLCVMAYKDDDNNSIYMSMLYMGKCKQF
jgi:hypothetical protein